jgi:hypothetical protein
VASISLHAGNKAQRLAQVSDSSAEASTEIKIGGAMTDKSIKLLALAVIYGCSLIGLAVVPWGRDFNWVIISVVSLVTGLWFLLYWLFAGENKK